MYDILVTTGWGLIWITVVTVVMVVGYALVKGDYKDNDWS